MKYWVIFISYTLFFIVISFSLLSCSHKVEPDATSIEYGTTENGKSKVQTTIKQTWKWSRIKKIIFP